MSLRLGISFLTALAERCCSSPPCGEGAPCYSLPPCGGAKEQERHAERPPWRGRAWGEPPSAALDQLDEALEQIRAVLGPRGGFGVVLDREHRAVLHDQALERAV